MNIINQVIILIILHSVYNSKIISVLNCNIFDNNKLNVVHLSTILKLKTDNSKKNILIFYIVNAFTGIVLISWNLGYRESMVISMIIILVFIINSVFYI